MMADFKHNSDSSTGSQNSVYCVLNKETRRRPSQTPPKVCIWCKQFWIPLMCGILFMVLFITVSVSFKQQFIKLTEVENKVANLTASIILLSSDQQDSNDRVIEMFGKLKADLVNRITNLTQRKLVLNCQAGWQLHFSSCYLFSSTGLDWQMSKAFCEAHGALLLILGQDTSEWNLIVSRISKLESYWIGLTDHTAGQWRWIDGSPYIMDKSELTVSGKQENPISCLERTVGS